MILGISTLIGTVIGVVLGWILGSRRPPESGGSLEQELRARIVAAEARDAQHAEVVRELQATVTQRTAALARAEAETEAAHRRVTDQDVLFRQQMADAKAAQEKALADLRQAFGSLSAEALRQNNPEFLRLAQENFGKLQEAAKGDLDRRAESIAGLLKPLEQQLKTYQERLQQSETTQTRAIADVQQQVQKLGEQSQMLADETGRFRLALSSSQARGRWGEATLRRLVEVSGMSPHCDFKEQGVHDDSKPDMVVRLPGNRAIVIDSKAPDFTVADRLREGADQNRADILKDHVTLIKGTIKSLADRDYASRVPGALDYVVMFIPAESVFSLALEADGDLIAWAAQYRIMLATPASLIALLRSVSLSWQQYEQTQNSKEIAKEAAQLFTRVSTFVGHFESMRDGLARANKAFNAAVGSYQKSVRPSGRRILDLGVDPKGKELPDLDSLEDELRALELDGSGVPPGERLLTPGT